MVLFAVEWRLSTFEGRARELWPAVDGRPLSDLAAQFENANGYEPSGGYAGLVLEHYNFGDLDSYLMGMQTPWPGERVPLLGCQCGEWGCWPLVARVSRVADKVRWDAFAQPHRPDRDYGFFGPFIFSGDAYRQRVAEASALAVKSE